MLDILPAVSRLSPQLWSVLTPDRAEQLQQLTATLAECQAPSSRDTESRGESGRVRGEIFNNKYFIFLLLLYLSHRKGFNF